VRAERVQVGQARRRRSVVVHHVARRADSIFDGGRITAARARSAGRRRRSRVDASWPRITASSTSPSRSKASRAMSSAARIAVPQRDLRPERPQVDDELRILDAARGRLGDRQVVSATRDARPQREVRERDMDVERVTPGRTWATWGSSRSAAC
jgi:hypothetical protein